MILNNLLNDLKNMNLSKNDTVFIHSSCKKIGFDANDIIDTLMEYFKDGLLLLPSHSWATINDDNPIFDPINTPSCVGIIPNLFMKRENVYRSLHPTHSILAYGKDAKKFIKNEEYNNTPATPHGVYDRLREKNAKILLIGVGNERNTFIHGIEEVLNIPNRLSDKPMHLYIKKDGILIDSYMRKHYNPIEPHISMRFPKLDKAFYTLGAMKKYKFGNATTLVCDANKIFNITKHILRKEPEIIINGEISDDFWNDYNE